MIINKLLVRQINIHGVGRSNISSLTELLYFSAPGKALRRGRGAIQDDERVVRQCTSWWCTSCQCCASRKHAAVNRYRTSTPPAPSWMQQAPSWKRVNQIRTKRNDNPCGWWQTRTVLALCFCYEGDGAQLQRTVFAPTCCTQRKWCTYWGPNNQPGCGFPCDPLIEGTFRGRVKIIKCNLR